MSLLLPGDLLDLVAQPALDGLEAVAGSAERQHPS
jgi:hypothetical protein